MKLIDKDKVVVEIKKTYPNEIAEFAVACSDALVKLLKGE